MSTGRVFRLLRPWMERFEGALEADLSGVRAALGSAEDKVPHLQLRLALQSDPAMEALLPGLPGCVALGDEGCGPFRVLRKGLVLVPPVLVSQPAAAAVAVRWGGEAMHALNGGTLSRRRVAALVRHGASLLEGCGEAARELFCQMVPREVAEELEREKGGMPSERLLTWQAGLLEEGSADLADGEAADDCGLELEMPMEGLLIAGGDSRLMLDPVSRLNKYGVCPRPRPEAVHFSSSTASAVSDHGFLYADLLRRRLLDKALEAGGSGKVRQRAVEATAGEIRELLGLARDEADVVVTPSGTDAELVSVMVALAGGRGRPLTNVLVAPEESGRGVGQAGAGRYFDAVAATREPIEKGQRAFGDFEILVQEVAIRDENGYVRGVEEVDASWLGAAREALGKGHRVLAHVLLGSKTGLSAPSWEAVERLSAEGGDRVDVVVDACQMRASCEETGGLVRKGWWVQVSGSKFFTGPPFSGALVMPRGLRDRAGATLEMLGRAPGVSLEGDWPAEWTGGKGTSGGKGSLGSVFRWLPALMEGQMFLKLPEAVKQAAFERFRAALVTRFLESPYVEPIGDEISGGSHADIGRLSILAFQVLGRRENGALEPLRERECQWLFEQLNRDMTGHVTEQNAVDAAKARLCCHIGQPVVLKGKTGDTAFLRLVLGARFFNFVGHAEGLTGEAALESEIADAKRVVGKIEWIAARWWRFEPMAKGKSS